MSKLLNRYHQEFLTMCEEDLYFVLPILLPSGSNIELAVEEILNWQKNAI